MEAVNSWEYKGLHLTVNGMGERAGNAPLASVVAVLNDFHARDQNQHQGRCPVSRQSVGSDLHRDSEFQSNKPIVGENVFHANSRHSRRWRQQKESYISMTCFPERFGRKRKYALGKTSGKANIQKNLQELGLTPNDDKDH